MHTIPAVEWYLGTRVAIPCNCILWCHIPAQDMPKKWSHKLVKLRVPPAIAASMQCRTLSRNPMSSVCGIRYSSNKLPRGGTRFRACPIGHPAPARPYGVPPDHFLNSLAHNLHRDPKKSQLREEPCSLVGGVGGLLPPIPPRLWFSCTRIVRVDHSLSIIVGDHYFLNSITENKLKIEMQHHRLPRPVPVPYHCNAMTTKTPPDFN